MEPRADLEQRSNAAQCRKEWRVTGSEIKRHFLTRTRYALPATTITSWPGPIPPDDAEQLMPSPPGVRHLGCTKAFLRNLFFGPSQGPQFPPLHLKRNILKSVDPVRLRLRRRDEGRETRASEEDFLPRISRIITDAGGVERPESSVERSPEERESFAERMEASFSESICKPACEWPSKNSPESAR